MAYGRGDKPIPKFKAPRLGRPPEGAPARGGGRNPGRGPSIGIPTPTKPTPAPKHGGKPGAPGSQLPTPDAGTPFDSYIEELRRLKAEEVGRQQAEANRIRQAYAAYAAYVKDLPDRIQALYGNAAGDQAQFANGFANGLRETAASQAAEINAQLAKINAPEGQQIQAAPGQQAGNVLYGTGGYIPAQALTTSGAAYASAAAFMGPNALKSGLLESQKFLTDNAGRVSDFDMEIAKAVGEQAKYRDDLKAQAAEQAAKLRAAGQKAKADRLDFLQDRADKLTDQTGYIWIVKGNRVVNTKMPTLDREKAMKPGSTSRHTEIFGSDAAGRYLIDLDTGKIIPLTKPVPRSSGGGSGKGKGSGKGYTDWSTSAGIVRVYPNGKTKLIVPAGNGKGGGRGAGGDFTPSQVTRYKADTNAFIRDAITGFNDGKQWNPPLSFEEAVEELATMNVPQEIGLPMLVKAYGMKNQGGYYLYTRGGLNGIARRARGSAVNTLSHIAYSLGLPKDSGLTRNQLINWIVGHQGKGSAAPSGGGRNASFSTGSSPTRGGSIIGTPYSGTHTLGNWESDNAIDVAIPYGTPIYAVEDGVIGPQFGSLGSSGRFAGLRLHLVSSGNEYYYAHLSRFAPGLGPNQRVRKGQLLGYSGAANGVNHLHFGMRRGDPRSFYRSHGSV